MPKVYDPILCMMVDEPTKARDVAPATQRYINTIVDENKANAEKFVRQAEQDDEVPENELKYVYKAYNEKFGYKFHDSASALNKAIKTVDGATRTTDAANLKELKDDYSRLKNASSIIGNIYSLSSSTKSAILKAIESGMREIDTRIDRAYMK